MVRFDRFLGPWKNREDGLLEEYVNNVKVGSWSTGDPNLTITSGLSVSTGTVTMSGLLDGDDAANVADVNTVGGIPMIYRIDITATGATSTTINFDITVADKIRVVDYIIVKTSSATGGGAENISVLSTGAVIGDTAHSWTGADKTVIRPTTLDDAQMTIAAGEILRVAVDTSITDEVAPTGLAIITAIKIA